MELGQMGWGMEDGMRKSRTRRRTERRRRRRHRDRQIEASLARVVNPPVSDVSGALNTGDRPLVFSSISGRCATVQSPQTPLTAYRERTNH